MLASLAVAALAAPDHALGQLPRLTVAPTVMPGASVRLEVPLAPSLSVFGDLAGYVAPAFEMKGSGEGALYPLSREKAGFDWYFWTTDPKPGVRNWFLGPRAALHQLHYDGRMAHHLFTGAVLGYQYRSRKGLVLHAAGGFSAALELLETRALQSWEGQLYPVVELRIGTVLYRRARVPSGT